MRESSVSIVLVLGLAAPAVGAETPPPPPSPNSAALDAAAEQAAHSAAVLGEGPGAPNPYLTAAPTPYPTATPPPAVAVAAAPAPAAAPASPAVFVLGLDIETVGFFEKTDWVAPFPELIVGQGNEHFRYALLFGDIIGKTQGYTAGFRLAGGWEARPVGFQLGLDLQFTYAPGAILSQHGVVGGSPQDAVEVTGSVNLVDVTFRYKSVLFELRAASVGETYDFTNGAYAPSFGGGVAVDWM
jgi:hypothetical protein